MAKATRAGSRPAETRFASVDSAGSDGSRSKARSDVEPPIKATFYLSRAAAEMLEDGWYNLRKLAPPAQRAGVTKSLIVRLAIELALQDIKTDGKSSKITKRMLAELESPTR